MKKKLRSLVVQMVQQNFTRLFSRTLSHELRTSFARAIILIGVIISPIITSAQAISESFEEAGWVVGAATNVSTTVAGATVPGGNGSWSYSALSISSNSGTITSLARTGKAPQVFSTSASYICTPAFSGGVTTVTVAVFPTSATTKFLIGAATSTATTNTAQLSSSYSTTVVGSSAVGIWTMSMYSAGVNMTSGQWNTITFTTNIAANQSAYLKFQRCASGSVVIDDISVTAPVVGSTPPTLTAATGATVDAPFNVTFPDDPTWRGAITSVTVGGTALTAGYTVSGGQITFDPAASVPANLLQTSGTKTIVVKATGYNDASVSQAIGAGVATKLGITTQPAGPGSNGGALATQPVIAIQDQYGNTTASTATVAAAVGAGSWTIGGTTSKNGVAGVATFTDLTASSAALESGATISFTSAGLTGITSNAFTIPAPLPRYRSNGTGGGDWSVISTWEVSPDGISWSAASSTPTIADGLISIRSGDVVTVSAAITTDETTVDVGGEVDMSATGTLTLNNGSGTDLIINGTLLNQGTLAAASPGTWSVNAGGTYIHSTTTAIATTLTQATLAPTSNFIYRGSSTLTPSSSFTGKTYGNLSFESTSGALSMSGTGGSPLAIGGALSVGTTGAGTVSFSLSGFTAAIGVAGNLGIGTGSTFVAPTGATTISVGGNWSNSGTFTSGTSGTVSFNGTTVQTVSGNTAFNILNTNNTSGTALSTATGSETGAVIVAPGTTISVGTAASSFTRTAGTLLIKGTINQTSTSTSSFSGFTSANTGFASTAVFNSLGNGGQIPAADWNAASIINITGITNVASLAVGAPAAAGYGNILVDLPGYTAATQFKLFVSWPTTVNIQGDLTLGRTTSNSATPHIIQMPSGTAGNTVNVTGNVNVWAGDWVINNFTTVAWTINGNLNIDATHSFGGATGYTDPTFEVNTSGSTATTVNLKGNLNLVSGANAGTGTNQTAVLFKSGTNTQNFNFNGTTAQSVTNTNGSVVGLQNFTVNNAANVTLANDFPVAGGLTLAAGQLISSGHLILKSSLAGTARLAAVATASVPAVLGDVTVERFIGAPSARRAWRLLTTPLRSAANNSVFYNWQSNGAQTTGAGTLITGPAANSATNGLDVTSGNSLKSFNGTALVGVDDTKAALLMTAGAGTTAGNNSYFIFVRGDRSSLTDLTNVTQTTLKATGALQTGDQVFTTNATNDGFSLLGNPYASQVDFDLFRQQNSTANIKPNYYYWDANAGGASSVGAYGVASWNGSSYDYTGAVTAVQTIIIPSGSAFFVQTLTDQTGTTPGVTFKETQKTSATVTQQLRVGTQTEKLDIKLQAQDASLVMNSVDGVLARFNNTYSTQVGNEDAGKLMNVGENLSIMRNGSLLVIEGRPLVDINDTLFLQLANMKVGTNYQFVISASNFNAPSLEAYLVDRLTGTSSALDLSSSTTVAFTVTSATASTGDRFMVVFRQSGVLPVNYASVKAYQQNNGIQVDWKVATESNIRNYEVEKSVDGRSFTKAGTVAAKANNNTAASYGWLDASPVSGVNYYRIKAVDNSGAAKYSQVVSVKIGGGKSEISMYPNPVIGNSISLQFSNKERGTYVVQLFNNLGQQVYSKSITHQGGSSSQTLTLDNAVSKGVYQLQVSAGSETSLAQQIIIR
jgi:hypothetical protein